MNRFKRILKLIGPGFVTGAADDDPSGIGTYSQTGAQFGYTQLWTALFCFPFMTIVQEMCGRIGMVTGKGLAGIIKEHYPKPVLYIAVILLFCANTINIGADLGAMAASAQLIIKWPFAVWLTLLLLFSLTLQIIVPYPNYARFLKYMTLTLFAYIITAFIVKQPWKQIAISTLVPTFSFKQDYLMNVVAILGTTISPYLFFWQANQEVEKEIEEGKLDEDGNGNPHIKKKDIVEMNWDTVVGMFFSQLVMFFIIITVASTLGAQGIHKVDTAVEAAKALQPIAGNYAFLLFALGIIGTGLLGVPILAGSASYAVSETLSWKEGLGKKFAEAKGFYFIIALCMSIGYFINFLKIPPFTLLYYTAILNGFCAPPLMVLIMLISRNEKIMQQYKNSTWRSVIGWIITGVMMIAAISLLLTIKSPFN